MRKNLEAEPILAIAKQIPLNFMIAGDRMLTNVRNARQMFSASQDIPYYSGIIISLDVAESNVKSVQSAGVIGYHKKKDTWGCECVRCVTTFLLDRCPMYMADTVPRNDYERMMDVEACYDFLRRSIVRRTARRFREYRADWQLRRGSTMLEEDARRLDAEAETIHTNVLEIWESAMSMDVYDVDCSVLRTVVVS